MGAIDKMDMAFHFAFCSFPSTHLLISSLFVLHLLLLLLRFFRLFVLNHFLVFRIDLASCIFHYLISLKVRTFLFSMCDTDLNERTWLNWLHKKWYILSYTFVLFGTGKKQTAENDGKTREDTKPQSARAYCLSVRRAKIELDVFS